MNVCDECGSEVADFEECKNHRGLRSLKQGLPGLSFTTSQSESDDFTSPENQGQASARRFILMPLAAVALDFFIPVWSTWFAIAIYIVIATAVGNQVLNLRGGSRRFQVKSLLLGLVHSVNTPKLIKLHSPKNLERRNLAMWAGTVVAAFLVSSLVATPGNAHGLERQIVSKIESTTGTSPDVSCPSLFTAFPGQDVTCRVKTILGISLPVVIQFNGPFSLPTWKVTL